MQHAVVVGGEAGIRLQLGLAHQVAQQTIQLVVACADDQHAVLGLEGVIGIQGLIAVADALRDLTGGQIDDVDDLQRGNHGVHQGHVHLLALAGLQAVDIGRQDAHAAADAAHDIGNGGAGAGGGAVGPAGGAHQAADGLTHNVIACPLMVGAVVAEAGDGGIDDGRVDLAQLLIAQAQAVHNAGTVILQNHIALGHFGDTGVKITPVLKDGKADIRVETLVEGEGAVSVELQDAAGSIVARAEGADAQLHLDAPHLWDGVKDPYLYTCVVRLSSDGTVVDEVSTRVGLRTFSVDAKKGFFLNGRPYPLHGVSRHQDRKGVGNAITREMHDEDMALIRELGANTVRLAHYQHDQYFYDLCDQYGMVVWAEIPYISEHLPNGRANTISQMKELIYQNYNHPCIVCWGVSNEITISTRDKADMLDNHRELNDLCHKMDSTRLTTLACYAMCGPFNPVAHITDLVSWNLYLGWYVPGLFLNDLWMDFFHLVYPGRPLGFSEYGAEGMPNLHSSKPRRGDHTEEYQAKYHEYMLRCFDRHKWMWATHVWNMFDFAADARDQGGEPGMNHKGLVTFDRKTRKDSFYLYKAWWSDENFVHICSKRFTDRTESEMEVKVYSNQKSVALYVNGEKAGEQTGEHVFSFRVPLTGEIEVKAVAGDCTDTASFRHVDTPNPSYKLVKTKSKSANWV